MSGFSQEVKSGAGLATITLLLAAWFLVDGIFTLIAAFSLKQVKGWGWMAFSGLVSILLVVRQAHSYKRILSPS